MAPSHIVLIVLVALLLFGPKKLPELGRSAGRMMREFKDGLNGAGSEESDRRTQQTKPITEPDQTK